METQITKKKTPFTPKEAKYQEERLEVLNQHFIKMIEKKEIMSGSYCLSRDDKLFSNTAIGKFCYKKSDERPFLPDTMFSIASITKLFTGVAILKLVEDGMMRLDQSVGELLEEFNSPPYNKITPVHLLTHTAGIIQDEGVHENKYYQAWWKSVKKGHEDKWIEAVLQKGLLNTPGTEWAYSTTGYMILGEIITRVSGMFCNDYIQKYIIDPCEMEHTCFGRKKEWIEQYNIRTDWMAKDIERVKTDGGSRRKGWELIPATGGGIFSTCEDLIKFGTMMLNHGTYNGKRIIGRKALEAMERIHTADGVKSYCWGEQGIYRSQGLGPEIFTAANDSQLITPGVFSHEGFGACCLMMDPKEQFVVVWTAQFYDGDWYAHALRNVASIMWSGLE